MTSSRFRPSSSHMENTDVSRRGLKALLPHSRYCPFPSTGTAEVLSLNESNNFTVHRLWPEEGTPLDYNPAVTVIFFHGLQIRSGNRAWETTWTTPHKKGERPVCWPREWLPEDLGKRNVVVYSLSYDADAIQRHGRGQTEDVQHIGKDLVQKLIAIDELKLDQAKSITLVGHSFGGLVLKSLLVEAKKQATQQPTTLRDGIARKTSISCKAFLVNVKCAIFYGTPHSGSDAATFAKNLQKVTPLPPLSGILKNLQPFEREMEELSVEFEDAARQDIMIFAIAEGRPISYLHGLCSVLVVPYASAMRLSSNNNMKIEDADHFEVCKPSSKRHSSYTKLLELLRLTIMPDAEDAVDPEDLT